jgi:hypothetical protein
MTDLIGLQQRGESLQAASTDRALPERVRKILHLIVLPVSGDEVVEYLPGVPI